MAVTNALDVAKFLVAQFQGAEDPITNLKLQKLLYYSQGWYLALNGNPLFEERIEAWPHGPVVRPVYGCFKKYQWNPITEMVEEPKLTEEVQAHLKEIMNVYGVHGAYYLEQLTHQEKPWQDARGPLEPTEPSTNVITHEAMRSFFQSQQ